MYDYGVVEYLQQNREHITAQSPLHKAANQVRADQSTYQRKCVRTCMRRPGCFRGALSSWHLQVACLHLKCWTIYSCTTSTCHSVPFCFVSERSGRNVPIIVFGLILHFSSFADLSCHRRPSRAVSSPKRASASAAAAGAADSLARCRTHSRESSNVGIYDGYLRYLRGFPAL